MIAIALRFFVYVYTYQEIAYKFSFIVSIQHIIKLNGLNIGGVRYATDSPILNIGISISRNPIKKHALEFDCLTLR